MQVHAHLDNVPRGAGNLGGDRGVTPGQGVQQCRFSNIGRTDNCNFEPMTKTLCGVNARNLDRHFITNIRQKVRDLRRNILGNLFVCEINGRLKKRGGPDQFATPTFRALSQFTRQDALCLAPLRFGFSVDQVCKAFDLGKIQPLVLKRAPRKLTWLGRAKPLLSPKRFEDRRHDSSRSMTLKLDCRLTREALAFVENQHQACVDRLPACCANRAQGGPSGRWKVAHQLFHTCECIGAGNADDGDACFPRRRRQGKDGIHGVSDR